MQKNPEDIFCNEMGRYGRREEKHADYKKEMNVEKRDRTQISETN
jgi:hypothetical protein